MNTHSPCIRALDVGYGNTKFSVDNEGTCEMFPSIAHRNTTLSLGSESLARRQTTHVFVDNQIFEVGPDASIFEERPTLHSDYIGTPQFRALALGALASMQTDQVDLLVTGLPVHLLPTQRTRLVQLLTGFHQINESQSITVREVKVIAQPLGGFANQRLTGLPPTVIPIKRPLSYIHPRRSGYMVQDASRIRSFEYY